MSLVSDRSHCSPLPLPPSPFMADHIISTLLVTLLARFPDLKPHAEKWRLAYENYHSQCTQTTGALHLRYGTAVHHQTRRGVPQQHYRDMCYLYPESELRLQAHRVLRHARHVEPHSINDGRHDNTVSNYRKYTTWSQGRFWCRVDCHHQLIRIVEFFV